MDLLHLIILLVVVGVVLWLINTYGATVIDAKILKILNIVVVVAVVLWIISLFIGYFPNITVGR